MLNILKHRLKTGTLTSNLSLNTPPSENRWWHDPTQWSKIPSSARKAISRSILIRHLDVGSCNAEEAELLALSSPYYDLSRFGIDFTASPRHADVLTISGPVTRHLVIAMQKTYLAMPKPNLIIAIGDGACNGSLYEKTYACLGQVDQFLPVDLYIPGDPPSPQEILEGLLFCKHLLSGKSINEK